MLKPPKGMHFVTILFRLWWCILMIKGIKFKDLSGIIGHICSRLPCYILTMSWLFCASLQNCHPTPCTGTSYINKQKEKKGEKLLSVDGCCQTLRQINPPLLCLNNQPKQQKRIFTRLWPVAPLFSLFPPQEACSSAPAFRHSFPFQ